MIINIPDDLPTTLTEVLTALEGTVVRVEYGNNADPEDFVVKCGAETDDHTVNLLAHPFRDYGKGYPEPVLVITSIIPTELITSISAL